MIDGMEPEDWIDQLVRDATDRAQRINRAVTGLQQRSFVGRTDDRSVEVEVNHGGAVTAIRLGTAVRDRDPDRLAGELMACIHRAGRDAAVAVQESMTPVLGADPATMAGLRQATEQQLAIRVDPGRPPRRRPPPDAEDDFGSTSWLRGS